ncbi:polysaccharide deacetylase family protein [Leucobacter sp. USHLN153]|uniref:polysaccharide deacetylase family protein n=1 Tax=Leucobacter sp. USHLN153 TaxID=3081268 RepID=UPI00301B5A19
MNEKQQTERTWRDIMAESRRQVEWPNGAVVASTIGIALESFINQSQYRLSGKPGERNEFSLSYGEYGVKVGVWRILELLDAYGLPGNFSISGLLAEQHPDVVDAIVRAGHDVVGHGWANDLFLLGATEEDERKMIRDTLDAIERASGVRPAGWASPANSSNARTNSILLEEGVWWTGDDASDDLPYVENAGTSEEIVILPKVNLAANDLIHWILPTNSTKVFEEGFMDTFDTIYREGRHGRPQWSDIVLHCHMAGRPVFIPTMERIFKFLSEQENVWHTTKTDLAQWVREQGVTQ